MGRTQTNKVGLALANLVEQHRRMYHVRNRRSYPGLLIAIGCGKAALLIGVGFAIAWYGLAMLTNGQPDGENDLVQNTPVQKSSMVDKFFQLSGFADSPSKVEIPATSSGQTEEPARPTPVTYPVAKVGVYNADWLLKQNDSAYVVQLASSTVKPEIYQKAFILSDTHPVVVYPFRKTRGNRLMYGYAIGMYDSFREAQNDVNKLQDSAVAEGVWIRPVGEIQREIVSVRQ